MFNYSPTVKCNLSMPRSEVITILMAELALLRRELRGRDQRITDLMRELPKHIEERRTTINPGWLYGLEGCEAQLSMVEIIHKFNQGWHDDLRLAPGVA